MSPFRFNEKYLSQISALQVLLNLAQREIDLLNKLAEKQKLQKRGLMQKLLTGEWRVGEEGKAGEEGEVADGI